MGPDGGLVVLAGAAGALAVVGGRRFRAGGFGHLRRPSGVGGRGSVRSGSAGPGDAGDILFLKKCFFLFLFCFVFFFLFVKSRGMV